MSTPSMSHLSMEEPSQRLLHRLQTIRRRTIELTQALSVEDQRAQTMTEVSPTWWHLAHTTWFFETLLLSKFFAGYQPFDPSFDGLLNSYYHHLGPQLPRAQRGHLSRPTTAQVLAYRSYVDQALKELLTERISAPEPELLTTLEVALHHEQQHQELILTDIKHVLASNPLRPAYKKDNTPSQKPKTRPDNHPKWAEFQGGLFELGFDGQSFCFDNERPRHTVFVHDFALAINPVTCGGFIEFIDDDGYKRPLLWLDLGWQWIQQKNWTAPLYWERIDDQWSSMTLSGMRPIDPDEPICHISFFEAHAFAKWAGHRLPTEFEWEVAAQGHPIQGNFADDNRFHPLPVTSSPEDPHKPQALFGDVWEWTQSSYLPYPGFQPWPGALKEYNSKFMCNQFVLRGGSCASPANHLRHTYRNYFPPQTRWQFTGLRLAR